MRAHRLHCLLTLILVIASTHNRATFGELLQFERTEGHMGTRFTITVFAEDPNRAETAIRSAFERIGQLDQKMSDYLPESELSRLNAQSRKSSVTTHVSSDVWRVLRRGQQLSRQTDGAFDMTLGRLTRLWRRAQRTDELPDAERLKAARKAAGFRQLKLHPEQQRVQLGKGVRLDLGGIAKGDALDQAMAALAKSGISRALIDGGGDMLASGPPPGLPGWRIGLVGLDQNAEVSESIWLKKRAIATSGDLSQHVDIDGRRYSHLIDPKTGLGLTRRSTVSVVADRAIDADALASAVSVMGPDKGFELLLSQREVEGRIVYHENGKVAVAMTPGFAQIKRDDP